LDEILTRPVVIVLEPNILSAHGQQQTLSSPGRPAQYGSRSSAHFFLNHARRREAKKCSSDLDIWSNSNYESWELAKQSTAAVECHVTIFFQSFRPVRQSPHQCLFTLTAAVVSFLNSKENLSQSSDNDMQEISTRDPLLPGRFAFDATTTIYPRVQVSVCRGNRCRSSSDPLSCSSCNL
jgi:hypothetical protein